MGSVHRSHRLRASSKAKLVNRAAHFALNWRQPSESPQFPGEHGVPRRAHLRVLPGSRAPIAWVIQRVTPSRSPRA